MEWKYLNISICCIFQNKYSISSVYVYIADSMFSLFRHKSHKSRLSAFKTALQRSNVPKIQNVMAFLGDAPGPRITYFVKGIKVEILRITYFVKCIKVEILRITYFVKGIKVEILWSTLQLSPCSFSVRGSLPNPPLHTSPPHHCHRHCSDSQVRNKTKWTY